MGKFLVGEIVTSEKERITGTIRHLGQLQGEGHPDSVWSEWNKPWNGKLYPVSLGGNLKQIQSSKLFSLTPPPSKTYYAVARGGYSPLKEILPVFLLPEGYILVCEYFQSMTFKGEFKSPFPLKEYCLSPSEVEIFVTRREALQRSLELCEQYFKKRTELFLNELRETFDKQKKVMEELKTELASTV